MENLCSSGYITRHRDVTQLLITHVQTPVLLRQTAAGQFQLTYIHTYVQTSGQRLSLHSGEGSHPNQCLEKK